MAGWPDADSRRSEALCRFQAVDDCDRALGHRLSDRYKAQARRLASGLRRWPGLLRFV